MKKLFALQILPVLSIGFLAVAGNATAQINFDGGPTGTGTNYLTPVNWSSDTVPTGLDVAVVDENFSPTLAGGASAQRLVLGNNAAMTIASGGTMNVGAADLYVGATGLAGIGGDGSASLTVSPGGALNAQRHTYVASVNPFGRDGSLILNGGNVTATNRFWVGNGAINDTVTGSVSINGSSVNWTTASVDMNLGGGNGFATINFTPDAIGVSTLAAQTLTLGGAKATLNVDFSGYSIAAGSTLNLFTYSGALSGTFGTVNFTGLAPGESASINYGTGLNSVISITAVPEPSTYGLILAAGALVVGLTRARSKRMA